jgi:hypothetical protein
MERFNLKKLHDKESKEHSNFELSNRSAVSEDLDAELDNNCDRETIKESTNISAKDSLYEWKKH